MLTDNQLRAIELLAGGHTQLETAAILNITDTTVSRWRHDAEYRQALDHAIHARWADMAAEAQQRILELSRTAKSERIRLSASQDICDRAGHKPIDRYEQLGPTEITIRVGDDENQSDPAAL